MSYPGSVVARDVASEPAPPGGGLETCDVPEALAINRARLGHLAGLGLPLEGRSVLDVGCGVGHLAQFFVERRCSVLCIDGREANISSLRSRYPRLEARLVDLDREPLSGLGRFEVVFCYGLLYHLENPLGALRSIASVCDDLLLIETMVCDSEAAVLALADEPRVQNQALRLLGCRPSPSWLATALNRVGFAYVYGAVEPPEHPDFRFEWRNDLSVARPNANLRCVFVASRAAIANTRLVSLMKTV